MTGAREPFDYDALAGRLKEALRDHTGFAIERMPGLTRALDQFVAEAQRNLAPLCPLSGVGTMEPAQSATLFRAIGDCRGLTAAIYASAEPEAQLLIALDERIDDLIVTSVFGESSAPGAEDESPAAEPRSRTAIETTLVEEFARALGRRDMPGAAARFSLPMTGGACECLILMPLSLLLPFRKELERQAAEPPPADRRWSLSMEKGVKQTRLPVTAILEEFPMSLGAVAQLRVGELLTLQTRGFDAVRLECAGRGMFLCKLGQGDGRYRLEVDVPIAQELEPAVRYRSPQ